MKIFNGFKIPTPFGGSINLPDLETPPIGLPKRPDAHDRKAIGHALGQDVAMVIGLIPFVGDVAANVLEDLHQAEIKNHLTPEEYRKFLEYNKVLPSSLAMARALLFK